MSLPLLKIGYPERWYGPKQNPLNEQNVDEMNKIIEMVIDGQSEDVCRAMRRLAVARGFLMNEQNWSAACRAVGITNAFVQQYPDYATAEWSTLFALFCSDASNDGPRKRSVYYSALKTNQFHNACLALRTEEEQSILTRLLTFHTRGAYQWFAMNHWLQADKLIADCTDFEANPAQLMPIWQTSGVTTAIDAFRKLIYDYGTNINSNLGTTRVTDDHVDMTANTALIYSIVKGNKDLFDLLMSHPAIDVDRSDAFGQLPIYWALASKRVEMAKALLDRGAEVHGFQIFEAAKGLGDLDLVNKMVAQIGRFDRIRFLILFATIPKDDLFVDALRLLVDPVQMVKRFRTFVPSHPMDLDVRFANNRTLLMTAAEQNEQAVTMWLIQNEAGRDLKDVDGNTALHIAAKQGHFLIVDILCDQGAKRRLKNKDGQTPIQVALRFGKLKVVEALTAF